MRLSSKHLFLLLAGILVVLSAADLTTAAPATDTDAEDVYVEDEEEEVYEEDDLSMYDTEPEIMVKGAVANAFDNRLPIGKRVSVLCGMINDEDEPVHVVGIAGTLNDPSDFSRVLMNFTGQFATVVNETLPEDSEATYAHTFRMPADMEAQRLQMALHIFYNYNHQEQFKTFFNETVEFVRVEEQWDADLIAKLVFTGLVGVAIFAFVMYKAASRAAPKAFKSSSPGAQDYSDYLISSNQNASPSKSSKSGQQKKKSRSKQK